MDGIRYARWIPLALLLVGASAGCNQKTPQGTPGQMPGLTTDGTTPKINATTYFAHAHLLERQRNLEQAEAQYRKALEVQPDFPTARNRLGIVLNELGRHAEATAEFRTALATHPELAYLQNNLGYSLLLEGQLPEAEAAIRRSLERKPDFARAHMNLGLVLAKSQRYDEALESFRHATDDANAYYNVAVCQSEAGLYSDAVRSLDQALRINPKFALAEQQMRQIADLAAQQDAADSALAATVDGLSAATPPQSTDPHLQILVSPPPANADPNTTEAADTAIQPAPTPIPAPSETSDPVVPTEVAPTVEPTSPTPDCVE